jgi:superfamily I DNA/RNA helicase
MFLEQLNPQQREAVEATEGPILILAGAGSGKTRVITCRIAHLIENAGAEPDSILAVTFTNKAAQEMAERVERLIGGRRFAQPLISTFHSFCVRVLRRDIARLQVNGKGLTRDFVIYDETDQQSVIKAALRKLGLDDKSLKPAAVLSRISWAKNHMLDPESLYLQSRDPKTETVAHVFQEYKAQLAKSNALDFDDLLLEAVRLLKAVPEVREYYTGRFHYILVDEYQDTNRPQYELLRLLAGERQNVCVVGDEDQSIYSWRGADIRNILEFERDFAHARIIRLEQNYRSTQNILEAASAVVANNVKRKGKTLWTARQGGARIGYYEADDGESEALFIADSLQKYLAQAAREGRETRAAVLYRTNSQSRLFEEALRRYGLKYNVVGGFSFYERAEIKDMTAYLKVIRNPDDSVALQRIINTPARGIGKGTLEVIERLALETGVSLWSALQDAVRAQLVPARAVAALRSFCAIIEDARALLQNAPMVRGESGLAKDETTRGVLPTGNAQAGEQETQPSDDISFDFGAFGNEPMDSPDGFGGDVEIAAPAGPTATQLAEPDGYSETGQRLFLIPQSKWRGIEKILQRLAKKAAKLGVPNPAVKIVRPWTTEGGAKDDYLLVTVEGESPVLCGWNFLGAIRHKDGINVVHPLPGAPFPESYEFAQPNCDHCKTTRLRKSTFILRNKEGELKQVGSCCVEEFVGHNPEGHIWFAEALFSLEDTLAAISSCAHAQLNSEAKLPSPEPVTNFKQGPPVTSIADLKRRYRGEDVTVRNAHDTQQPSPPPSCVNTEPKWWNSRPKRAAASTAELLKFLLARTGYLKLLEEEDSPDSLARAENLRELVNAAMDSRDRGESLSEFLDHAALVSDQDSYDARAQITLMTLHAAKGLEFPLVFLAGLEEKLFPHSRTLDHPEELEEERRLCYVGMTRAQDRLILARARYRRRWGTDLPEASVPSRFLAEVPPHLLDDLSSPGAPGRSRRSGVYYDYEDEGRRPARHSALRGARPPRTNVRSYNSIENIAEFFASRGRRFSLRKEAPAEPPSGACGFRPGERVRHPIYGVGTVHRREGDGEAAKITVQFQRFGLKKLVERFAQLERISNS